eukprot:XP_014043125.1 PREDICTED: uncharacterized protein K02A2.6-like [Salmo salar]
MAHEGHLGIVKVKQRCRDLVWWPGIDHDIEALVRDCAACLLSGKTGQSALPPLQPLAWPSRPWEHIQLDICGEIHGHAVPHHQRFLVVVYDLHSKWPEVVPVGTVTAQAILDILDSLFTRWGLPLTLTTDNGPQLISAEFSSYLSNKGIKHIRTAYYNPQANGGVERFNQTLKNGIRAHLVQGCTFQTALNQTLMHYRARAMKQRFDKAHRVKKSIIQVSDWVRARRPQRCNKMASFWSEPLQVSRQLGPATFMLSNGSRWHASRLRKVPAPQGIRMHTEQTCRPETPPDGPPPPLPPEPQPLRAPQGPEPQAVAVEERPMRARTRPAHLGDYLTSFHS